MERISDEWTFEASYRLTVKKMLQDVYDMGKLNITQNLHGSTNVLWHLDRMVSAHKKTNLKYFHSMPEKNNFTNSTHTYGSGVIELKTK